MLTTHEGDYSDSDDQFTDAQSAPMSPQPNSPLPLRTKRLPGQDDSSDEGETPTISAVLAEDEPKLESKTTAVSEDNDDDELTTPTIQEPPTQEQEQAEEPAQDEDEEDEEDESEDGFGDDFDDFEEGGQDDDFDDFEEGFEQPQAPEPQPQPQIAQQKPPPFVRSHPSQPTSSYANSHLLQEIPDFDGLSPDEVISTTEPHLAELFPSEVLDLPAFPPLPKDSSLFLNPRSASLWSQLVAPPPLAPPDWIRSRTRRLFLVSLGVPVDLDEILPASKQKKLVLPSLNISATSPRTSSDSRSASRLKQGDANASSTSLDTQNKQSSSKRRKGPPPQPELDLVAARYLCNTTDEALGGMTDAELKSHIEKLEAMQGTSKEMLEYWQKRTDEKIGDREAFEGVIENLVKHARKVRK